MSTLSGVITWALPSEILAIGHRAPIFVHDMTRELWAIRRNLLRGQYDQPAMTPAIAALEALVPATTRS